ncbi:hypothetical protein, partial [Yersinia aldovae]|uniref:hypothetical protein n=1 Tax=Yersinia aldovae TaxID=29483 RepID=UPI0036F2C226
KTHKPQTKQQKKQQQTKNPTPKQHKNHNPRTQKHNHPQQKQKQKHGVNQTPLGLWDYLAQQSALAFYSFLSALVLAV